MFILCTYRQLTDSATDKGYSGSVNKNKLLNRLNTLWKMKMSMQNHSKLLLQLKDYLNKAGYDKNLQIIFSKYWLDFLQRVTYSQINTLKKLSALEFSKHMNDNKDLGTKQGYNSKIEKEKVILNAPKEETLTTSLVQCKKVSNIFWIICDILKDLIFLIFNNSFSKFMKIMYMRVNFKTKQYQKLFLSFLVH